MTPCPPAPRSLARFSAVLALFLAALLTVAGLGARRPLAAAPFRAELLANAPLAFIQNRGQAAPEIRYLVSGRDRSVLFTRRGLLFRLTEPASGPSEPLSPRTKLAELGFHRNPRSDSPPPRRSWTVALDFVGGARPVEPVGEEDTGTTYNFFRDRNGGETHTGVRGFGRLVYRDLWPGIDLVYRGTQDQLKYEFVVRPGADPGAIHLRYRGAEHVELESDGRLKVATPVASFHDERPDVFQNGETGRETVEAGYRILRRGPDGNVEFGFRLGNYDRGRPLIIDPAVLIYCGFVGGFGEDLIFGVAVDTAGHAYITGSATAGPETFPITVGPDVTPNGSHDAFVAKVRPDGTGFIYCGYIGGPGWDAGHDIAVDAQGNAYVAGRTQGGLPVVSGPALIYNSGLSDAFVAKLNPGGTGLIYCGYIGGSDEDQAFALAVDDAGCAYVVGGALSWSQGFPVRNGPELEADGLTEAFISKVSADGSELLYSGFIGGTSDEVASDVVVDAAGHAFVCGYTSSDVPSFPIVAGPILTAPDFSNAFVCKISPSGTQFIYSGFLGGNGPDYATGIAVDANGVAYVCGWTYPGINFPVVGNSFRTPRGEVDAFLTRISPNGIDYLSSGLIGGNRDDLALAVAIDSAGSIYLTGHTSSDSPTFPVSVGPFLTNSLSPDAFVLKLRPDAQAIDFCGYLGGLGMEAGAQIAVNPSGDVFVGGYTGSTETSFPVVAGPQLTWGGGSFTNPVDGFLARIRTHPIALPVLNVAPAAGGRALLDWTDLNVNRTGFELERRVDGGTFVPRSAQPGTIFTDSGLTGGVGYTYRVRAVNSLGGSPYSNEVRIVALDGPPAAPANLQAVAQSTTTVELTWTDTNSGGAETRIERALGSGPFELRTVIAPGPTAYLDTGLVKNTQYRYRLLARSAAGFSASSNIATVTTPLDPPPAPSGLMAQVVDGTRIDLSWTDNSVTETGFKLERAVNGGLFVPLATVAANVTTHSDAAVQPGSTYRYSVRAVATGGESARVLSASVTVPLPRPTTPANLHAEVLSTALIALTWVDTNSGQAGTSVERSVNDGGFAEVANLPPGTTSWEDTTVVEDTRYRYRVAAKSSGGTSPYSDPVAANTPLNPPLAPSSLTAQVIGGSRIDLSWTDASTTEAGFKIERSVNLGPMLPLGEVDAGIITYSDATVQPGTTYRYAVKAFNSGGESSRAFSTVVTVILQPPAAPQGVSVEIVTSRALRVTWSDASDNEAGFRLRRKISTAEFTLLATLPAGTTLYSDTVQPSTTYTYRVVAYNEGGESAPATSGAATTPKEGKLTVTPARLTFPVTKRGVTAKKVVTVKNTGAGPLSVIVGTLAAPFAQAPPEIRQFTLAARASKQIPVTFTPTAAGAVSTTLTVTSDVKTVTVPINGRGR